MLDELGDRVEDSENSGLSDEEGDAPEERNSTG